MMFYVLYKSTTSNKISGIETKKEDASKNKFLVTEVFVKFHGDSNKVLKV